MRHLHGYRKLGRRTDHRLAMLSNMATSLIIHERIFTTVEKAKELRRVVDKVITLGKRGDLHARRMARNIMKTDEALSKVFSTVAERFSKRNGGYTRILKHHVRFGDGAKIAIIELVDYQDQKQA